MGGMTYPCPSCRTPATLDTGCPGCGRPPDPEAAEVVALNEEYAQQRAQVDSAHRVYLTAAARLESIRLRHNELAARVAARAGSAPPRSARTTPPVHAAPPPVPVAPPIPAPAARPEASVRTVQNVLFVLGGLLLGSAAIVFTAVAWASFGVLGRAVILAVTTVVVLAVPPLALLRRLAATAETFAALGLLLVLLDGYAAWYVNFAGVATVLSPSAYAGTACAVTAALAWGYGAATGLVGPRYVALAAAQPVLLLFAARTGLGAAGWTALFAVTALGDVAVGWRPRRYGLAAGGWVFAGLAGLLGVVFALAGEISAGTVPAALRIGAALVFLAAVPVVAASAGARRAALPAASAALTAAVVGATGRVVLAGWPSWTLPLLAAVVAVLALGVRALPSGLRGGPRAGLGTWTAVLALVAAGWSLLAGARTVAAGFPVWRADLDVTAPGTQLRLPAALILLALAAVALLPGAPAEIGAGAGVLLALAVPVAVPLAWWGPSLVDGVIAVPLVVVAVLARRAAWCGVAGAFLAVHAVAASLARPTGTAVVTGALVATAAVVAVLGRRGQRGVGAVATGAGLLALPLLAAALAESVNPRAAAVLGLVLVTGAVPLLRRWWPEYATAGALAVPLAGIGVVAAALAGFGEPTGPYVAVVVLCELVALRGTGRIVTSALTAVPAIGTALPAVWSVVVAPLGRVGSVWSGAPRGTGITAPLHGAYGLVPATVTLALLTAGTFLVRRRAVPVPAGLVVLVGAAALGAPWPAVPALGLAIGLAAAAWSALRRGPAGPAVFALSGLAGALPTRAGTLAALGATTVVAAVCAVAGRSVAIRAGAWVASAASATALTVSTALAADLTVRTAALWTLVPAAAMLATAMSIPRRVEAAVLETAAHATAGVALLLTTGSIRYAAGVCTLWGLAIGLSALRPGEAAAGRQARVVAASTVELLALWLLLADRRVAVLEAYTLPAAAVALLAGWLVARRRPSVHSWAAYGPALLAAFAPSTATLLGGAGEPARRLVLGLAALAVVLAGAVRRRQSPVVVGGAVLAVVALHETVLLWDLVQRWILLGAAGLVLIGFAVTYERRRRDVTRLVSAVSRLR
jgi:hypothetical protein